MVIIAVIRILYVHVQKADLNVGVSLHSNGPAVVGIVGIGSRIKWGRYLTWIPGQIITVHWEAIRQARLDLWFLRKITVGQEGIIIDLICGIDLLITQQQ